MERLGRDPCRGGDFLRGQIGRRELLQGMVALGGALAVGGCRAGFGAGGSDGGSSRMTGGQASLRWLGGGVMELATPDYKQIAYLDAWVWNNTGRRAVPARSQ